MKETAETFPALSTRNNSLGSNDSSVISWRYSTSMSMDSSSSSGCSMKYINIDVKTNKKADVGNKKLKENHHRKPKKNFVLANKKTVSTNKTIKLESIASPVTSQVNKTILKVQNGQMTDFTLPRIRKYPCNQNNNNHTGLISSVRLQWPENKITQVEHKFKGEIDRLERTKEDLTKRNRYLEKEICKEQEVLRHSFPGRTLDHLKLRNSILIEQKYEAQKADQEKRTRADFAEEEQRRVEQEYDEMTGRYDALQEEIKQAKKANEEEQSVHQEYNESLDSLSTRLVITKDELSDNTILFEETRRKNESDSAILQETQERLKHVELNCDELQRIIQVQDVECSSLSRCIDELKQTKERLVQAVSILTLDLEKASEVLKLSQGDASKLRKHNEELQIIIDEKDEQIKQQNEVRMSSKDVAIQTSEILTHVRTIAWIRIAEEEVIFSPFVKQEDTNEQEATPIIEIIDNNIMKNCLAGDSVIMTSHGFKSMLENGC